MNKLILLLVCILTAAGCSMAPKPASSPVSSAAPQSLAPSEPAITQSEVDARTAEIDHMQAYFTILRQSADMLSTIDGQVVLDALAVENVGAALAQIGLWQTALEEIRAIEPPPAFTTAQQSLSEAAQAMLDYLEQLRAYAESPVDSDEALRLEKADSLRQGLSQAQEKVVLSISQALERL